MCTCSENLSNPTLSGTWKKCQTRRLSDYVVTLTILEYGGCTTQDGWIRENVRLIEMLDFRGFPVHV